MSYARTICKKKWGQSGLTRFFARIRKNWGQSGLTRFFRTSRLGTIPQGDDHETQSIQQTV